MFTKIVHIATDEKFINSAILQFEKASPFPNVFYIRIKTTDAYKPLHVQTKKNVHFRTKNELLDLAKTLIPSDLVIFHSLPSVFFDIVLALPKNTKIIWMCFGFEIYNDPLYFSTKKLLGSKTKKYYQRNKQTIAERLLENYRISFRKTKKQEAIERIDFIGTAFKEEFEALQKYTKTKKRLFHFWYYPLELIINTEEPIKAARPNVLIGNSASITNNHLEAFTALKNCKRPPNLKIIVPFSYSEDYHSSLVKITGERYFGNTILFLEDFMDLRAYNQLLKSCGFAIFYNKRQQAIGNTIALLWYGAKVFLSVDNPFYHFLKRKGVIVFNHSEIDTESLLGKEEILNNRKILKEFLSTTTLQESLNLELMNIKSLN